MSDPPEKRRHASARALTLPKDTGIPSAAAIFLLALPAFATATVFIHASWPVLIFQLAALALLAATLVAPSPRSPVVPSSPLPLLPSAVLLLPLAGLLQLLAGATTQPDDTRLAVLHWASLAAVFLVARSALAGESARRRYLGAFLIFAAALSVLCLLQLFSSEGRVLWLFESGYRDVYGTFPSYNNYAQFVELALPVALWFAVRYPRHAWVCILTAGLLYASVIGSLSRAGAILCTAELLAFLPIARLRGARPAVFAFIPVATLLLTAAVGWEPLWRRFQQQDPYLVRREFVQSAVEMVQHRPLTGFGLGSFPKLSNAYAVREFSVYANHVHNDWLEFAAEGGIPFALLVLWIFASRVPAMFRRPWSLGLLAVMLHACVDYPFPRPAVSGWMFALLGALAASEEDPATEC